MKMDKFDILKLDNQFCFSLYSLSKDITRLYKPHLDELGLTYTQYITMLVLWEKDGINVNEIGHKLCLDSGTLTPLLKKLQAAGLIERTREKDDERNVIITLTEKGKEIKEHAVNIPYKVAEKINLPFEKIIEVRDTLKKISEGICE